MSRISDSIRDVIAVQELEEARQTTARQARYRARKRLWDYAQDQWIIDFNDTETVSQRHRDWRASLVTTVTDTLNQVNAATTVDELLVIFDTDIAPHI